MWEQKIAESDESKEMLTRKTKQLLKNLVSLKWHFSLTASH